MSQRDKQDKRMVQYLLGQMSDKEQIRLEETYFADDAVFEQLSAVETELIDAYVQGQLAAREREAFEKRYLGSPRQRDRIAFARNLYLDAGKVVSAAPVRRPAGGWRAAWEILRQNRYVLMPAATLAILITVMAIGWWVKQLPLENQPIVVRQDHSGPKGQPNLPSATLPAGELVPPQMVTRQTGVIALVLLPGLTRSGDHAAVLAVPKGAEAVWIRVEHEGDAYPHYRMVLRTPEGREVATQTGLQPEHRGARSVVVALSAGTLKTGEYVLTLSAAASGDNYEDIADYSFRVVQR